MVNFSFCMRESKRMTNTMKHLVSGHARISSSLIVQKCTDYSQKAAQNIWGSGPMWVLKQPHAFTDLMEAEDLLSVPSGCMDKEAEQKLISALGSMQCTSPS